MTNAAFEHLDRPSSFLTCPVEYCANRADPSVPESEYLDALGRGLHEGIGVFWTGRKVVSETITKEEVIALERVIRRKPIIWDNLVRSDGPSNAICWGGWSRWIQLSCVVSLSGSAHIE